MFFRILKRDLKRKKAMNAVMLSFILLATMFVASGISNVVSVTNGIDSYLDKAGIGDYVVIHDTGAHGFSMGYNYNGKLRSAELLLKEDGTVKQIRRAETPQDYFATLDYPGLKDEK